LAISVVVPLQLRLSILQDIDNPAAPPAFIVSAFADKSNVGMILRISLGKR